MNWKIAIIALMLVQLGVEMLTKSASDTLPKRKAQGVAYQFFFCALLAFMYAGVKKTPSLGGHFYLRCY